MNKVQLKSIFPAIHRWYVYFSNRCFTSNSQRWPSSTRPSTGHNVVSWRIRRVGTCTLKLFLAPEPQLCRELNSHTIMKCVPSSFNVQTFPSFPYTYILFFFWVAMKNLSQTFSDFLSLLFPFYFCWLMWVSCMATWVAKVCGLACHRKFNSIPRLGRRSFSSFSAFGFNGFDFTRP